MRKLIVLVAVGLVALVGATIAWGAAQTTLVVKTNPNKASKSKQKLTPMALTVNVGFSDPAAAQVSPLKQVVIRLQKGGVYNGKLFPRCKASALLSKGVKGCPAKSQIGTGTSTASAKPIIDLVNAKLYLYNGELKGGNPTIIIYAIPDISSPLTVTGTVAKKPASSCANGQGQCDYTLTFDVPDIPTLPNAPPASVLTVNTTTKKVFVKKKKRGKTVKIPLIGAPTECKGKWVAESNVTFKSGEKASAFVSAACKK